MKKENFTYKTGYLPVGHGHNLYYELWGNPNGVPVLFFHGGPGAGFTHKHQQYFDPHKHNVVFFDQRGSGKSKPFAATENNTTQLLIADSKKLLDYLDIKKVHLFGRSWGSTMALVFAIDFPQMVLGMTIGGIFLATKEEIDDFYLGTYSKPYYPEVLDRFLSLVPESKRDEFVSYCLDKMHSDDETERERYLYEWALFETSIMTLDYNPKSIEREMRQDESYKSLSLLEAHYMLNNCFLDDNFILNNAKKIEHIPTSIIQGRYDIVCPPLYAYKLYKKLSNADLIMVTGGHRGSEPRLKRKTIEEMSKIG